MEDRLKGALAAFSNHLAPALQPGGPDARLDPPPAPLNAYSPETFARLCTALAGFRHLPFGNDLHHGFTDGYGDFSCDGLFVLVGDQCVTHPDEIDDLVAAAREDEQAIPDTLKIVFIQAKSAPFPTHGDVAKFAQDVQRFLEAPEAELVRARMHEGLLARARACRAAQARFPDLAISLRLIFAFSGEVRAGENVDAEQIRAQAESNLRRLLACDVDFAFWGADELVHAYESAMLAARKRLAGATLLPLPLQGPAGFIGYVAATDLAQFIRHPGDDSRAREDFLLFYDNVRHHLGDGPGNVGAAALRQTLQGEDRTHVVVRNNGVTIIARSAEIVDGVVELVGAQIVNGAQTSITLLRNAERLAGVHVPLKIVVADDERTKAGVIRGANTQAAVNEFDMLAIEPAVRQLAMDFDRLPPDAPTKVWLQRRRNEFVNARRHSWHRVVTPRDLLEAFGAVFLSVPHEVHDNPRDFLALAPAQIFNEGHEPQIYRYLAWLLAIGRSWGETNAAPWARADIVGNYPARHQFLYAAHLVFDEHFRFPRNAAGGYDLRRTGELASGYRTMCDHLAGRDGEKLARRAAAMLEEAANALDKKLDRNLVRTRRFTEAVAAHVTPTDV